MSRHDVSWRDMSSHDTHERDAKALLPLTPAVFHVLLSLVDGQKHGYLILKDVAERTGGEVELSTGTLYGIVKRLLADGVIRESALGSTDRRRAYKLTEFGRRVAQAEAERLREMLKSTQARTLLARRSGA
jgi:DNA-binding PadR family transcriptional regulator